MADLTWTNTWLAILAVIAAIQFLIMCAAGFMAYRMYQQAMTDKVRHAQDSVSDALRHVTGTGSAVAGAVKSKTWPIVGIIQGLKSVATTMMGNGRHDRGDRSYGAM